MLRIFLALLFAFALASCGGLQDARAMCWSEEAQRGIDRIIAAIVVAEGTRQ